MRHRPGGGGAGEREVLLMGRGCTRNKGGRGLPSVAFPRVCAHTYLLLDVEGVGKLVLVVEEAVEQDLKLHGRHVVRNVQLGACSGRPA